MDGDFDDPTILNRHDQLKVSVTLNPVDFGTEMSLFAVRNEQLFPVHPTELKVSDVACVAGLVAKPTLFIDNSSFLGALHLGLEAARKHSPGENTARTELERLTQENTGLKLRLSDATKQLSELAQRFAQLAVASLERTIPLANSSLPVTG